VQQVPLLLLLLLALVMRQEWQPPVLQAVQLQLLAALLLAGLELELTWLRLLLPVQAQVQVLLLWLE
jgi:hypothetical protein